MAEQVAEVNGQLIPGPPKTAAGRRTVTLPAVAAAALAEHLAEFAEPGPEGLVFLGVRGWLPAPLQLPAPLVAAGDPRGWRGGVAVPRSSAFGCDPRPGRWGEYRELMEPMGHTSPVVALRYQHVMAGRDQAIAAALDELVQAAASLPPEPPVEGHSGTLVARNRRLKAGRPPRSAGEGR